MLPKQITPAVVKKILARRKWFFITPLALSLMVMGVLVIGLPRSYLAETLILVQAQRVPEEYIRSTVTIDIGQRLRTIGQQVMSRTRLQKIISDLNLYPELRGRKSPEELIDVVRDNIRLAVPQTHVNSFTLGFSDSNPDIAAKVANALASHFIEENLKVREEQAKGTTSFLEQELSGVKERLVEQEKKLKEYKQQNMGELPEQRDANINTVTRLQEELGSVQLSLNGAKDRKLVLQKQITDASRRGVIGDEILGMGPGESGDSPRSQLGKMKMRLNELLVRYTERHPDVVRLQNEIAKMEKFVEESEQGGQPVKTGSSSTAKALSSKEILVEQLNIQMASLILEIGRLEQKQIELRHKIEEYQVRIDNIPRREQELMGLSRDYEITKANYQSLLQRQMEAKMAENMEKRQKGEQFVILDPAIPPKLPDKPNLPMITVGCIAFGLLSGVALCFVVEFFDPSFRNSDMLAEVLGFPVLATLSYVQTNTSRKKLWLKRGCLAVLAIVILTCYSYGIYYIKAHDISIKLPGKSMKSG